MATKREIKTLLKENLQSGQLIQPIISILQGHLQRDLDTMEDYYIKYKALKYSLDAWVEKCTKQLQALEPEYLSENLEDINALTVKALSPKQFPRELRLLTQNTPFKFLEDFCSKYVPRDARSERLIILDSFKTKIWNNVLENVEEYRDAREYLEQFQLLLTESGISKKELISGLKLPSLSSPLDEDDLFTIQNCLGKLKQKYGPSNGSALKILNRLLALHENKLGRSADSEKLIVKNKLGLRLEYFVKAPTIGRDERGVVTVCGCVLSISEVYEEVLKHLGSEGVHEVHLYSPDVILVDRSLIEEEFKGVNFVVSTTMLIITGSHVWDFSGQRGQSAFSMNPPKAVNTLQNGLDGEDGKSGQSGGNVHILISSVIGQGPDPSLHIRSNGGDGGSGQPGGEGGAGIDGEDGDKYTTLDEDKFKSMIPKVSRFNDKVSNKHQLKCYQALIDIMDAENGYLKENKSEYHANGEKFVYQSIITSAGAEAGFSIYEGPIHSKALYGFHAFYFASSGTEGSDGGHGGRGGRGGSPGYAGEIDIQLNSSGSGNLQRGKTKSPRNSGQLALITVEKSDGSPGKDAPAGRKGQPGKPGRKGTDYACVHPFNTLHGRTFYKGALIKRLHESKTEPSPYCGYAKSKIHFENSLREITRLKSEHKRFELKARAPLKTAQKQRSIIKTNTQHQFQAHCRRYFLNIEFGNDLMLSNNQGQQVALFQSGATSIHTALQTLQIASRICDFNPRDPIPPPRKKRVKETAAATFLRGGSGSSRSLPEGDTSTTNRKSLLTLPPSIQTPLLALAESLLQSSDGNRQQLSRRIQELIQSSKDPTSLSIETCEKLLCSIIRHDEHDPTANGATNSPIVDQIKINLTQNLRSQLLHGLHTRMLLLPEVGIGKIRKLDPNFTLAFIKHGGQLENNFHSTNLHAQIGQDLDRYLLAELAELGAEGDLVTSSSSSQLFTVLKTSIFEKGVTNFAKFMEYLSNYTKKHVKKLSKHGDVVPHHDSDDPWPLVTREGQRSIPRGLGRLGALEYCFFQDYFEREGVGPEHHAKLKTTLVGKLNKWLGKQDVLIEYGKKLCQGPLSDWDFDILATIYGVNIRVYKRVEGESSSNHHLQLRYSAQPLLNSSTTTPITNGDSPNSSLAPLASFSHPQTLQIIETSEDNYAPLATASTIANQAAQIYLELLNDTSRPEFFEEFDLSERESSIQGCFSNRRFTLSKFYPQSPSPPTDLTELTQNLFCNFLAESSKIVRLALTTSLRFDNRLLEALLERMSWQGNLFNNGSSSSSATLPFVELGLAILGSDEVDVLHLEWITASLPQPQWILEFTFILLQQGLRNFNNSSSSHHPLHQFQLTLWKSNLSSLDPMGLSLLGEKIADYFQERRLTSSTSPDPQDNFYQQAQLVRNLDQISSIISEISLTTEDIYEELVDLRLEDWVKMLTNLKIRKTFLLLHPGWELEEGHQDYKKCIYYASSLYNEHPGFIDNCLRVLRKVRKSHPRTPIDIERLVEIFSNYYHGLWCVASGESEIDFRQFDSFEFFYTVLAHQNDSKIPKGARSRDEILKFISNDKNTTLRQMDVQRLRFELREEPKSGFGFLDPEVPIKTALSKWAQKVRSLSSKDNHHKPSVGEMLFCLNSGILQCKGFYLRDTQKVTLVTMLQEEKRNVLAQVATGEGKSLIVVAWAIIKVLLGGRCDVITSSPVLAERDAIENRDVFDLFHVTVGHNSNCDIENRKSAYKNDVVYGDVANFQRDYLLNKYHEKNILGERSALENLSIMVDEVDSMLLDKGNSVLYLSHKPAGMEALNPIFIFIWKTMNLNSDPEQPVTFDLVRRAVQAEMYTIITPEMLECLEHLHPKEDNAKNGPRISLQIHSTLHELGFLDQNDRYTPKKDHNNRPLSLPDHLAPYEPPMWYIIKAEDARKRKFVIPKHLQEFVDLHLDTWINSAFRALELTSGKEYIVDTASKSFITPDKDPKVIIVDRDTGVDLFQSHWNAGLHQFLQLKHSCAFSNLTLKAIFISNISYFRRYGLIHGLTGTLGSDIERNFLKKTYSVEFVNIPTATPKKFVEELPVVVGSVEEWRDRIVRKATELAMAPTRPRSVLVICESINDADYLQLGFVNQVTSKNRRNLSTSSTTTTLPLDQLHVYKRSYEKFSILSSSPLLLTSPLMSSSSSFDGADGGAEAVQEDKELCPGQVIISTNLAGRGTDIKISEELNKNGGLCVILSYLPNNIRVEQQAFGRAARKGQNGSGILIVRNHSLNQTSADATPSTPSPSISDEVTMVDLKNDRDEAEVFAMSRIEAEFESLIGYEESLFHHFGNHFQRIKPKIKELYNKSTILEVVLATIIDKWAFWLDKVVSRRLPYQDAILSLNQLMAPFNAPFKEGQLEDGASIYEEMTLDGSLALTENQLLDLLDSPSHLVSIGKLYLDKSMWSAILGTVWTDNTYAENALPFFDKAIAIMGSDSTQSTIPLYYKAYTLIIQEEGMKEDVKAQVTTLLRSVERGFRALIAEECSHVSVVSSISLRLHEVQSFIQVEAFKEQRKNMIALYQLFIDSIHSILGSPLLPTHFQTLSISSQDQIQELLIQLSDTQLIQNCSVIELPPCNNAALPGGLSNTLIYRSINPDMQLLEDVAVSYGLRSSELHELIYSLKEECERRMDISNEDLRSFFQQRLRLPTRDEFWEALISSRVVGSLRTVGILPDGPASRLLSDPIFRRLQKEGKAGDIFAIDVAGHLFYTSLPHSTEHVLSRYSAVAIRISYNDAVNCPEIRDLVGRGLIQLNQYGLWSSQSVANVLEGIGKELEYGPGYYLKFDYALIVLAERGVPIDYLDYNLFYYLEEKGLLSKQGLLLHTDFHGLDWGKYAFFRHEVISVLQLHCIYRVYALYLDKEIGVERPQTGVNLSFINTDPCSSLVNELFYAGVLQRNRILPADRSLAGSQLQAHFKSALEKFEVLSMTDVSKFFARINIPIISVEAFWFYLISKDWLRVTVIGHVDEVPTTGRIHIPKNLKQEDLQHPWNSPQILNFLIVRGSLVRERHSILASLERFTCRLNLVQNPDGALLKVESQLGKAAKARMTAEIGAIQSMGLDSLMSIYDKGWSAGKIGRTSSSTLGSSSSGASTSSGYLQIAAGIAISVYSVGFGAFSGQLLIDQGISDMCFSLMSTFSENLSWEGYWSRHGGGNVSSLIAMISPAVSSYLMGGGSHGLGAKIVCKSAANGQSTWLRMAINAGHQLGQEVIKVIITESSYSLEVVSIEQKIKSKYDELVTQLNAHLSQLVQEFTSSDPVSELIQELGSDEARSELILTLTHDDFCPKEGQNIEACIQSYADQKLELVRNWAFEKKNLTSKTQLYLKLVEKFLKSGGDKDRNASRNGGQTQSEDLVEEIGRYISNILRQCVHSINKSLASKSNSTKDPPAAAAQMKRKSSVDVRCENKSIAFEINSIFCRRIEEVLYDLFLAPVCNTITSNFLRDADASLIRQLSQSRRNLVRSFTILQKLSRVYLPKRESKDLSQLGTGTANYDPIEEMRLKRLCQKLIDMEAKCTDPYLLSEFVLSELSSGPILLQACANLFNCTIILKELDGSRILRRTEVHPANPPPRQGDGHDEGILITLEIPALNLSQNERPTSSSSSSSGKDRGSCDLTDVTAANLLENREKAQRVLLDALLSKLYSSKVVKMQQDDLSRDELRHQLADVIKSDVAILMSLRNRRMNMNK